MTHIILGNNNNFSPSVLKKYSQAFFQKAVNFLLIIIF